jgi:hypothetical protein
MLASMGGQTLDKSLFASLSQSCPRLLDPHSSCSLVYSCLWLLERYTLYLFSSSEPMLWDYVPVRYIFDGGDALMIFALAVHGLKEVWIALDHSPVAITVERSE